MKIFKKTYLLILFSTAFSCMLNAQRWDLGGNPDAVPAVNGLLTNSNFFGSTQTASVRLGTGGVSRIFISGTVLNPGFIGVGNGFTNPVSLLHLHQPAGNNVFLRFSNAGTGGTNLDGFVVGMLNGTVNGDACLIQYEPNPIRFFIRDVNVVGPSPEKMQLTYGGQMAGGTADGLRIFNPGYTMSVANAAFNSIDIYTGVSNTTYIRLDNGGEL